MQTFQKKRITVLGLGNFGGGVAVSRWLVQQGATVLVADQSPAEKLSGSIRQLSDLPIEFHFGSDQREEDFTRADMLIASPAVPPGNRFLQLAISAGVPVTTEICLFVERCKARIIGVTGTKGKSTTSTLLQRMLSTQHKTWLGGNIGKSLLADLPNIQPDHLVVLELSSFMLVHLGLMKWSPHAAVVTMISADHLDWHGSETAYIDAKRNIVRFQTPGDFAVLNSESPAAHAFADETPARVVLFEMNSTSPFELRLAGRHNQFNAQGAFAAAKIFGVDWAQAQAAIAPFDGLPHRLQLVHSANGIQFINDSISTIPETAIAALECFPAGKVIHIVGGSGKKNLPIDSLCRALAARAKAVPCIGETAELIQSHLPSDLASNCVNLETAVEYARKIAVPGDIVLLSPGHPSYDQFTNFESRGARFELLVKQH